MTHSKRVLLGLVVAAGVGASVANAPVALAAAAIPLHLRLTKSEPAKSDTVSSPKAIRLWFSLAPTASLTSIRLTAADARSIPIGKATVAGAERTLVEAAVSQILVPGRYTVAWKTASADLHPVTGTFTFVVR
jgi:methionine-rich copper-binding protein CopC